MKLLTPSAAEPQENLLPGASGKCAQGPGAQHKRNGLEPQIGNLNNIVGT